MKKTNFLSSLLFAVLFTAGCSKNEDIVNNDPQNMLKGTATISMGTTRQMIDGFGASTAWSGALSDGMANGLFSTIGLSIDRLRIDPGGSANWSQELSNAQKANARGAKVFATPWTPPTSMKSNNNVVGGTLKTSSFGAFASYLKSFGDYIKAGGVNLFCISVQNEPDYNPTYESCSYTGATMRDFLKASGQNIGYPVIVPETVGSNTSFADAILNDGTAVGRVSFVGFHLYGSTPVNYSNALNKGKRVWMTEHYYDGRDMTTCMKAAKEINDCMANNYSAYVWWWVTTGNGSNCYLTDANGNPNKMGRILGMYAKYVRPGCWRVDAASNPTTNVYVTAYKDWNSKLRFVVLNTGTSSVSQAFSISGSSLGTMTVYRTDSSHDMSNIGSVSGTSFSYSLPGQSVTTFVQN
jgi:glucuronoarabinoxylan endo-1,4-beta-xylanase